MASDRAWADACSACRHSQVHKDEQDHHCQAELHALHQEVCTVRAHCLDCQLIRQHSLAANYLVHIGMLMLRHFAPADVHSAWSEACQICQLVHLCCLKGCSISPAKLLGQMQSHVSCLAQVREEAWQHRSPRVPMLSRDRRRHSRHRPVQARTRWSGRFVSCCMQQACSCSKRAHASSYSLRPWFMPAGPCPRRCASTCCVCTQPAQRRRSRRASPPSEAATHALSRRAAVRQIQLGV